jgi:hypothetical protein
MRYKPLPRDSHIDPEVALLQAASAMDAAGEMAEKLNDIEGLLNVAAMWMKFSEDIHGFAEAVEKAEEKADLKAREGEMVKSSSSKIDMGFRPSTPDEEPIVIVEEEEDGGIEADDD